MNALNVIRRKIELPRSLGLADRVPPPGGAGLVNTERLGLRVYDTLNRERMQVVRPRPLLLARYIEMYQYGRLGGESMLNLFDLEMSVRARHYRGPSLAGERLGKGFAAPSRRASLPRWGRVRLGVGRLLVRLGTRLLPNAEAECAGSDCRGSSAVGNPVRISVMECSQ